MNIKQKSCLPYRVHTPIKSSQVTADGKNQRKLRSATKPENRLREKVEELTYLATCLMLVSFVP